MTSESDADVPLSAHKAPTSFGNLYPRGDIVAPVADRPTAETLADELRQAGRPAGDVEVMDPDTVLRVLEELERRRGFLGRLGSIFGDEHEIAQEFADFARQGNTFVVVHVPDEKTVELARPIVSARSHAARYYGRHYITDL